ncbi:MAG: phytanoyl-CoA dioxygenase family protein [Polyangiaceae bacterium]|nr:phytanoyl-CoA dioxygenase family protein [Polyangiaceae bacterium]
MRFTPEHVSQWREEGFTVIENFFSAEECAPVLADYEALYGHIPQALAAKSNEGTPVNESQFQHIDSLPFRGSSAINLMPLHPQLIAFAKALLGVDEVHLYQAHTWAKFTGATDYDQKFHCDFGNHTLTVPSEDVSQRTVDFIFYFTDVTRAHGALRYVTKPDVIATLGHLGLERPNDEENQRLLQKERAVEVPAGSLVAHGIDTMHRGSNLTAPNGRRFSMTVGYKAAGNDNIGFHVWQVQPNSTWPLVFKHASPEQLACLGIPRPGAPFWTQWTLEQTQARWPDWDMREYFAQRSR